ncbi:hypothetical protein Leryth_019696 [Lithospermum erythrorhizon]|nr:hypothetical protein Leryth_019696 [Lithospermum erythrorhizon]
MRYRVLKAQNLSGIVPPNLVKLPFLKELDLTRNYLNGSIPVSWGSMNLVNVSLIGNRISGSLPIELVNISTLAHLVLEYNQISGTIPPEFGDFPLMERILLTSNNLTGELPGSLEKLSTLKDFRISDNQFTGSIPNFILNWTNIEKIVIQGSGLTGPIPPGIASLTKLTDLRISDLKGNDSTFPPLSLAKNLKTLILRSCNITGQLPDYLGTMANLKHLDLSFNKLTGKIPSSYINLSNTDYIYLTGNKLSGPIPDWMFKGDNIDLSYNNLTTGSASCQSQNLNMFASSYGNTSGIVSCLRNIQCPTSQYALHINCGGREVRTDNGTVFDDDVESGGPAKFFQSRTNWAFSSTGIFLDDDRPRDSYTWENISVIVGNNSQLYSSARLSPLSLTYYGFCLLNGNYTVNLHFAEIMFTDDISYTSLGRRMFDVYIQEKLVLKDFNIANEAGGVNKVTIRTFTSTVDDGTLEIRFYWAGKGTNGIPVRGVYGPLISAISVEPDFPVPSEDTKQAISAGAISGIVVGAVFIGLLTLGLSWWKLCYSPKDTLENDLKGLDLHTGSFTLRQIKAATNNFDPANKIGEGGFGSVYKGCLADGTIIAVKQLSSKSKQGNREFINEIGMISALQHPNLVKLYGCCIEGNQLLLIYEYMENNSLARALFGPEEFQINLDWKTRRHICIGIARGLAYLHEESRLKIVHRDIKATNVLLDKNLDPKISDFGLAKLDEEDNTHISTRIAGTYGYMAPEYAMHGYLTDKADVYSFGIVALEIVSGKSNTSIKPREDCFYLLDWARASNETGNLMDLIDPRLGTEFNVDEAVAMIKVALHCSDVSQTVRPNMSTVVSMLEGKANVNSFVADNSVASVKLKKKAPYDENSQVSSSSNSHLQSTTDVHWTESSVLSTDLYPIALDSDYLEGRE